MSAVTKWLQIQYLGGDPWVKPVWSAVNSAITRGACGQPTEEMRELGVHISTRLTMLPRIYQRINEGAAAIRAAVSNRQPHNESTPSQEGYAFDLDDQLKLDFLLNLDSLLFELNSVCELITRFLELLYSHAGRPLPAESAGLAIKKILQGAGQDSRWFRDLDGHRNFFSHNGAPYFAVDLSEPAGNDFLIMKKNLRAFADKNAFLRLTALSAMVRGFETSKPVIQNDLIRLFATL